MTRERDHSGEENGQENAHGHGETEEERAFMSPREDDKHGEKSHRQTGHDEEIYVHKCQHFHVHVQELLAVESTNVSMNTRPDVHT